MKLKFILTTIVLLTGYVNLYAQQPYYFSQFHEAPQAFNPAFTGIDDFLDVRLIRRNQWPGFDDSPTTNYIGIYGRSKNLASLSIKEYSLRISNPQLYDSILNAAPKAKEKIRHGYGGNIIYDSYAPFSQFIGNLNYSLHLILSDRSSLAIGVNVGFNSQKIDLDNINLRNPDEAYFQSLLAQGGRASYLQVRPGILFYTKSFYLGYSAGNLLNINIEDTGLSNDYSQMVHYLQTGAQFPLGEYLKLQSSLFYYYYDNEINSLDVSLKLNVNQRGYVGASYRTTNYMVLMGGLYIQKKFHIGYSYDMKVSGKNDLNNGAHEIALGFLLFNDLLSTPYTW